LPNYQLWLLRGGHSTPLTPRASVAELLPVAASANGNRLIADYEGPGIDRPWAVQLSPRWVRALATGDTTVQSAGISRDGRTLLLERRASGSRLTRVSSRRSRSAAASRRGSPAATRPPGTADPPRVGNLTKASCSDRRSESAACRSTR
jgi:hypothetical protein